MFKIKKSNERGYANHNWLTSYHSFSFANYYNPEEMNFSDLRVINDDIIQPSYGFGTHPHNNMEIFTYVLSGQLKHSDTLGNESIISAGDVQLMSAGSGVRHSEFNPSTTEPVHLLQIWIRPNIFNTSPTYQQKNFIEESKKNKLKLVISPDGSEESLTILQDAYVYSSILEPEQHIDYSLKYNSAYIHVISGILDVSGATLKSGDAVSINYENDLLLKSIEKTEFLIFDLK